MRQEDEEGLTKAIIRLATRYGRYGYRRITALLRTEGWLVNAKRVRRIWRQEGLKVPQRQPHTPHAIRNAHQYEQWYPKTPHMVSKR